MAYGPDDFAAIEVKNTARVRAGDLDSLRAFVADYPKALPIFLYRGSERLLERGVWCLPVEDFLARLHPSRGIGAATTRS